MPSKTTYQSMQDDDGTFFVNRYTTDSREGFARRETLYSGMPEEEADFLCSTLNRNKSYLHN